VPVPKLLELTVTVEVLPTHGDEADMLKLDTLGLDVTLNVEPKPEGVVEEQPLRLNEESVNEVLPALVNIEAGIENVPVVPLLVIFEVRAVPVFAPVRLYVAI
jgi:hypothetical protein